MSSQFSSTIIVLNILMVLRLASHFRSGFYNSAVMRGSTRMSFFLGAYFIDVLTCMLFLPIVYGLTTLFGFVMPAFWLPAIIWTFTQPLWTHSICYLMIHARGISTGLTIVVTMLADMCCLFGLNIFSGKYVSAFKPD